jgi:hypothetical protein
VTTGKFRLRLASNVKQQNSINNKCLLNKQCRLKNNQEQLFESHNGNSQSSTTTGSGGLAAADPDELDLTIDVVLLAAIDLLQG